MSKHYKAFISYSHKDSKFADWLHKEIESWSVPKDLIGRETNTGKVPPKIRPIFKDRDDFSGGHSLQEATLNALANSSFLLVICSPNSANSQYVNEEVRQFKLMGKADRIIPIILAGEPNNKEQECFPDTVKFNLTKSGELSQQLAEPIAPDVRDKGDGKKRAVAKIIAGLLGVAFDEIIRREEQAQKKRLAIYSGLATGAFLFATLFASFALYESYQANTVIKKGVFTIASLVKDTDGLSESNDISEARRAMLRTQCDLQQGLAKTQVEIDVFSRTVCLIEQVNAMIKVEETTQAIQMLNTWYDELSALYQEKQAAKKLSNDLASAYLKTAYELHHLPAKLSNASITLPKQVALYDVSFSVGKDKPDLYFAFEINDAAFWQRYEDIANRQDSATLITLFQQTIALRLTQAEAYQYDNLNKIRLNAAEILTAFSWLRANELNQPAIALNHINDAQQLMEREKPKLSDNENTYRFASIYITQAEVQLTNNKQSEAKKSFNMAKKLLKKLLTDETLSNEDIEQLTGEIEMINARLL